MLKLRDDLLLYFKCSAGHLTACNTTKHRLFFCKQCNIMFEKRLCPRFTDRAATLKNYYRKSKKIVHEGKVLYQYPESFRRNYRRKKKDAPIPE